MILSLEHALKMLNHLKLNGLTKIEEFEVILGANKRTIGMGYCKREVGEISCDT